MGYSCCYHYVQVENAELFTAVCLPQASGRFPTVIYRSPYVDSECDLCEQTVAERIRVAHEYWLLSGYAVVYQHCRGRGKSSGECVPYVYEREDSLLLQEWIRKQPFYNGELYLCGHSYTSSIHFVTAPFASDVKGAILEGQDCERYNCNYRNGFYKMGLHGGWYVGMYKKKQILKKNYVPESYNILPLIDFSKTVFGERAEDFDEILLHPDPNDAFWETRYGGGEAHDAIKHANIPILLVTGFYDIYTGGVFDMWNRLDEATKAKSALVVHPYDHGCHPERQPLQFQNGTMKEAFGDYKVDWLNFVRGKNPPPFTLNQVTYYQLFGNAWRTDGFDRPKKKMTLTLGAGERTYRYNPYAPASFRGGLSANFGGCAWQDQPNSRYDILSFYTPEFEEDVFVKGKMEAKLCVRSDCEDTCFYVRLSLEKPEGDYGLRDDINQISNFCAEYVPNGEIEMTFSFDEHAFVIRKGERLRVDVSSSAFPWYVRHTNQKGPFALQTTAKIAENTVICDRSTVTLFYE